MSNAITCGRGFSSPADCPHFHTGVCRAPGSIPSSGGPCAIDQQKRATESYCIHGYSDRASCPICTGRSVSFPLGCICPPGANKDCEAPLCPRKRVDFTGMSTSSAAVPPQKQCFGRYDLVGRPCPNMHLGGCTLAACDFKSEPKETATELLAAMGSSPQRRREQKLVDIMFEIAVRMHQRELVFPDRESCAAYVAMQLRECGFDNQQLGSSWGVLK